jgi:excinuclease ABC subunit A
VTPRPPAVAPVTEIRISGARSHNLRGVDCSVPLRALTVVTGVSGSGKSTLAFDTLYAEGQRRYVQSLSTYARQFLERLPRPEVDSISYLPPAIAIEQRNRVTNARSTIGTATEILDHLRLLYAAVGETRCPDCDRRVEPGTIDAVAERIGSRHAGERISIGAPLPTAKRERATALRERLLREGFGRLLDPEGRAIDLSELGVRAFSALRAESLLLVDRFRVDDTARGRLAEALATGFLRGGGRAVVVPEHGDRAIYREGFACDGCGRVFATPVPALFSFNSPLGACEPCQGFGRIPGIDWERVVPDPSRTIAQAPIVVFNSPSGKSCQRDLVRACRRLGVPTDRPFSALSSEHRELVLEGDGGDWYGVRGFFEYLEERRYKVQNRVLLARYRRYDPCGACGGMRLRAEARAVHVAGRHLGEVSRLGIAELARWLEALERDLEAPERARAARLLEALVARVATALDVGLGYLTLDRQVRTLSGGEAQRIQLATALGGTLTAALYVLDEPSIGLHARDVARLLGVLRRIRDGGNTVVVVEHALDVVGAADHVIDLGPGAGRLGGTLVVEGPPELVRRHPTSQTARALRGELGATPRRRREPTGKLRIVGASEHNLREVSVDVPLGQLVAVTGVSGAGKSTLVRSVLVGNLRRDPERGACERIEGASQIEEVVVVEQSAPARSSRSNPATVSKAFEGIRRAFAATREARALGVGPGWFSFNVAGGRCEACEGSGEVSVDMQFLDDVRVPCASCNGSRYRPEAAGIRLGGRTIVDVLALTLAEAAEVFATDRSIADRLRPFLRVGLGYLTLGQPLSTLSGGEGQRLRLGLALAEGGPRRLYVLDEPTTGLHAADVEVLIDCLDELLDGGASVVVVEHNLDLVRRADWVIDVGPEGGPEGGLVVAEGSPDLVARSAVSRTGAALRAAGMPG